ncbi:class A beta-lactamase [Actinokineospora iranica]|uniref:Beta-lactamase n=1 Tax=Actinokineospora iranica TaxID=1271860 RepID=A0A1G6XQ11_9PSEU|nr:class A beta-lactamase [Actinokineospora iranica]SDD79833.1 beta-lactamase class A [Actinokineospora iranica]
MTPQRSGITRRTLLGTAALLPLAACTREATPAATTTPTTPTTTETPHTALAELERKYSARLGVYAIDTATNTTITHHPDDRFAFCSAFKALAAAAVLHRNPLSHLDTTVQYTRTDLMKHSPITARHVATGMTIRQLCDAAIRFSDGTAGNLLLRDLGGPARLTDYARGLGDTVTRMDRTEPDITEATPGDPRDTSSPRAFGSTYHRILLGDALPTDKRDFLRDLLDRGVAGADRIRAGVPKEWAVAHKSGTGDYGTLNDFAVVRPPNAAPLVVSIMSSKADRDADSDPALLAETAAYVVSALTQGPV